VFLSPEYLVLLVLIVMGDTGLFFPVAGDDLVFFPCPGVFAVVPGVAFLPAVDVRLRVFIGVVLLLDVWRLADGTSSCELRVRFLVKGEVAVVAAVAAGVVVLWRWVVEGVVWLRFLSSV
jgi:hypothetical protein